MPGDQCGHEGWAQPPAIGRGHPSTGPPTPRQRPCRHPPLRAQCPWPLSAPRAGVCVGAAAPVCADELPGVLQLHRALPALGAAGLLGHAGGQPRHGPHGHGSRCACCAVLWWGGEGKGEEGPGRGALGAGACAPCRVAVRVVRPQSRGRKVESVCTFEGEASCPLPPAAEARQPCAAPALPWRGGGEGPAGAALHGCLLSCLLLCAGQRARASQAYLASLGPVVPSRQQSHTRPGRGRPGQGRVARSGRGLLHAPASGCWC